jgi:queuine/archaeosine tRNA-ribosyltransferase
MLKQPKCNCKCCERWRYYVSNIAEFNKSATSSAFKQIKELEKMFDEFEGAPND